MLSLELSYRPPLAWRPLLAFLAGRAIPGVELVEGNRYIRSLVVGADSVQETGSQKGRRGWILVEPAVRENALRLEISLSLTGLLDPLLSRVRNLFDLDARPLEIEEHLCRNERLRPIVKRQPGLRLPGTYDPFEMAVRAVLGQQVSVRAATTLAGRVAKAFGDPLETPYPGLDLVSFTAERVSEAQVSDLTSLGLTRSRAECLIALARSVASSDIRLRPGIEVESTIERLKQLPGIGDWTAHYIAMRALRWPDAFPYSDLGLRKALGESSSKKILEIAESWRPWRAYGVMHLWNSLSES